jgi:hypothetical protein
MQKRYFVAMFSTAFFKVVELCNQPRCPTGEWERKCGTYTQWNITQPQRRQNHVIFRKTMDVETIVLSEISHICINKHK